MVNELFAIPIFPVFVTLMAFRAGVALQKKVKSPLCNPILVAVILILVFHFLSGMDLEVYKAGNGCISWLLTPATVSLAVGMYEQFQILRKHTAVLVTGVAAGAVCTVSAAAGAVCPVSAALGDLCFVILDVGAFFMRFHKK